MNLNDYLYSDYSNIHLEPESNPNRLFLSRRLQEFQIKVGYIVALETGGKICPEESYRRINTLWERLKQSRENTVTQDDSRNQLPS